MIYDKLVAIICETMEMTAEEISPDSTFESFKMDSLDMVETIMAVEDEFGIEVPDDLKMETVGEFVKYIEENM
ncbi:MAG: acyl carrier protein [Clostridiales bacterium]|nr:acyl carrier protein [Clostridiales bacterium]